MKELFKIYQSFDDFVKMQLTVGFISTLSWSLVHPIIVKLQGLLWTAGLISVYFIAHQLSSFLLPYLERVSVKNIYRHIAILDALYLVSVLTYFVNTELFLYIEASLMVSYNVIVTTFWIEYNALIMDNYGSTAYKNVQYSKKIITAVAAIIGYSIVIVVGVISSMEVNICVFMVVLSINLSFRLYSYVNYWKDYTV